MPGLPLTILLAAAAAVVSESRGRNEAVAGIDFVAHLDATIRLTVVDHDLSGGVVAYVGTVERAHTTDPASETVEVLALRGERVGFSADQRLVAWRHPREGAHFELVRR